MNKKLFVLFVSALMLFSAVTLFGCSGNGSDTLSVQETTVKNAKLVSEITDCVKAIAKADKTNALEDELVKFPEYYIDSPNGYEGMDEFRRCIKEYFYTCDTEFKVISVDDVTGEYKSVMEKDIKENHNADVKIQQVAVADIDFKYTNYSTDNYIDDTDFNRETQYFIKIDGTWYYGWGIDQNMEHQEIEQ